jgi:hypothetical protein
MNCQEYWDTMPELDALSSGVHPHLNECAACAARMNRQRQLSAGLRAVSASDRRVGAPSRVEARLRAAFRASAGITPSPWRTPWAPGIVWAAAFVVLLALAVVVMRNGSPVAPRPAPSRGAELALATHSSDDSDSEYEGFIPLPNAARLSDTEDVNVVRVEVPRSAMLALGLEVSPERASELVAADVMLGPDGLARAVRFLDAEGL